MAAEIKLIFAYQYIPALNTILGIQQKYNKYLQVKDQTIILSRFSSLPSLSPPLTPFLMWGALLLSLGNPILYVDES